jgi:hypothetical protein
MINAELLLTSILVGSTLVYTLISWLLLVESKKTRQLKIAPLIIAFLKSTENHNVLALHIKNIGEGLAKNVKVRFIKDYSRLGAKDLFLSDVGIAKNGFNIFPPQYVLNFYIHFLNELESRDENGTIEIEIEYESTDKRKFKNIYALPFNQIGGQNYSNPPETFIGQIPHYLKEINNTLKSTKG